MLGKEEIERRFGSTAVPPERSQHRHVQLNRIFVVIANALDEDLQDSREKSLALTQLEDSSMWAHKAVAREG